MHFSDLSRENYSTPRDRRLGTPCRMTDHCAGSTSSAAKLKHSRVPGQTCGGRGNICRALSQSLPSYQHMTGDQQLVSVCLPPSPLSLQTAELPKTNST